MDAVIEEARQATLENRLYRCNTCEAIVEFHVAPRVGTSRWRPLQSSAQNTWISLRGEKLQPSLIKVGMINAVVDPRGARDSPFSLILSFVQFLAEDIDWRAPPPKYFLLPSKILLPGRKSVHIIFFFGFKAWFTHNAFSHRFSLLFKMG